MVFLVLSCNNNSSFESIIDISRGLTKKEKISLSTIAEKVEYIQLQSDSICMLRSIRDLQKDIVFQNNKIYIKDNNKLLCFDRSGNYIRTFGKHGRGPGEYSDIRNFSLLPENETVVIHSAAMQQVLFYDHNGVYQMKLKIDFWPTGLTVFNNQLVFINSKGRRNYTDYFTLSIMDQDGSLNRKIICRENEKIIEQKEPIGLFSQDGTAYGYSNSLHYWEYNYDTIWRISNDFNVIPHYYIYYGKDKLPFRYLLKSNARKEQEIHNFVALTKVLETSQYFFFDLNNKGWLNRIIYNKNNKTSHNLQYKDKVKANKNFAFFNDIDNGIPFWPQGIITGNKVFQLIYPYELKKYIENNVSRFTPPLTPLQQSFLDIASNTTMEDNPILMIVELKH